MVNIMMKAGKFSTLVLLVGYLVFLIITIKTSVVDAVVLLLTEEFGNKKIYQGNVKLTQISNNVSSIQYVLSSASEKLHNSTIEPLRRQQLPLTSSCAIRFTLSDTNPNNDNKISTNLPSVQSIEYKDNNVISQNVTCSEFNIKMGDSNTQFANKHITASSTLSDNHLFSLENKSYNNKINFKVVDISNNNKLCQNNISNSNCASQPSKLSMDDNNIANSINKHHVSLISTKNDTKTIQIQPNYNENLNSNSTIKSLQNCNISLNTSKSNVNSSNTNITINSNYTENNNIPSITSILKSILSKRWVYNAALDRYTVRLDKDLVVVLTIRPNLQMLLENLFENTNCKIGCAIIQDPYTGAILAMTSYENGKRPLSPDNIEFIKNNWALRSNLPVASLFKIITAAAGIEKAGFSYNSSIKVGKKWSLSLWEAFAKSHNTAFGVVGKKVGKETLQKYANSFGFNRPFFFDLPVEQSIAEIPYESIKLAHAAAGLYRDFEISPIHAITIISTVVNSGKMMKPYLVDYILKGNQVIFRRKPFQLGQPISRDTANQIYEMMKTTLTHGTGKRGFSKFENYEELSNICGGKTGTLTGKKPKLLITWFGGYTKFINHDISILFMVGQQGFNHLKAADLAGRFTHTISKNYNFSVSSNNKMHHNFEKYCIR